MQSEYESKLMEFNEDKRDIHRQLEEFRREQRIHDTQHIQTIQEFTDINLKLSQDLQIVCQRIQSREKFF